MPSPSSVRREKGLVRHTVHQLLHVDVIRYVVARSRFLWFVSIRRKLRTLDSPGMATNTVTHNLKGLGDFAGSRSLYLTRPLSTIERLTTSSRVLVVGPRTEGELFGLVAYGFEPGAIRGLDLIAYSPWVDLGDMHHMPYPPDSFDAVVVGWVMAYSESREQAAAEVVRVVRPGGVVAIGVEWSPVSNAEIEAELGYLPGARSRITGPEEILSLFGSTVDEVLVREGPDPDKLGPIVVIFSTRND